MLYEAVSLRKTLHVSKVCEQDCAVCLQPCHYPTQLPCGHVFCFLCVKGVAIQNKKCALCRAEIPLDYLDHPVLLGKVSDQTNAARNAEEYQWYYEGSDGWWKYDERSNSELESAFRTGAAECKLLLAGALYRVHFASMLQRRSREPARRRRVRRDSPALPSKGIAGIKMTDKPQHRHGTKSESDDSSDDDGAPAANPQLGSVADDSDDDAANGDVDSPSVRDIRVNDILQGINSISLQEPAPYDGVPSRVRPGARDT